MSYPEIAQPPNLEATRTHEVAHSSSIIECGAKRHAERKSVWELTEGEREISEMASGI